jgi:hypothetical protein
MQQPGQQPIGADFEPNTPSTAGTRGLKIGSECALYVMAKLRKWLPKSAFAGFLSEPEP